MAPGNELLPDGFLDDLDVNPFAIAGHGSSSGAKVTGLKKDSSSGGDGGDVAKLFKDVEGVLNEDLVKKVNAIYSFKTQLNFISMEDLRSLKFQLIPPLIVMLLKMVLQHLLCQTFSLLSLELMTLLLMLVFNTLVSLVIKCGEMLTVTVSMISTILELMVFLSIYWMLMDLMKAMTYLRKLNY